jgi:hypothetical protein
MLPNFSGRWQFDAAASTLRIGVPDSVVLTIEHEDPLFRLERTLVFGDRSDTFGIELTVGSDHPPFSRGDATIRPLLRWDGDELVFMSNIVRPGEEATNIVRHQLEDFGRVLVAEERYQSPKQNYDNRWVFKRG